MLSTNFSNPNRPRILLADDQQDVLEALRLLLKGEGFATETVNSPAAVLSALSSPQEREFDLMLMDMNYTRDTTSGLEGLELIEQVRRLDDTLPVVVMTAWGSIELAVESMREGGCDFIQKTLGQRPLAQRAARPTGTRAQTASGETGEAGLRTFSTFRV